MAYISNEEINEIRSRANIVDIISGYLQVSSKGKNYVALCPFHLIVLHVVPVVMFLVL